MPIVTATTGKPLCDLRKGSTRLLSALLVAILGLGVVSARADDSTTTIPWKLVAEYPHNDQHFTQGLELHDGKLFESAGGFGHSQILQKDLKTDKVISSARLPRQYFGEGLTWSNGQWLQLTWRAGVGIRWSDSFQWLGQFPIPGEGWGLASYQHDGQSWLILSDGSARLTWLDPATFAVRKIVNVTENGKPVDQLNELESVRGQILANVWHENRVVAIEPATGNICAQFDFSALSSKVAALSDQQNPEAVLNGIAYDARSGHLLITGKLWPRLYEVSVDWPDKQVCK